MVHEVYPEGFEEFWRAYPRKVGKRAALSSWERAVNRLAGLKASEEEDQPTLPLVERRSRRQEARDYLLARTTLFAASAQGQAGQFCPHAATWLNQSRYDDDPAEWNRREQAAPARPVKRLGNTAQWNPY